MALDCSNGTPVEVVYYSSCERSGSTCIASFKLCKKSGVERQNPQPGFFESPPGCTGTKISNIGSISDV